jgi:putative DNA primase/helicase
MTSDPFFRGSQSHDQTRTAVLLRGDQVPLRAVQWLWKDRFAFGKLALIAGDPGRGKSQIALDIVARCTTGEAWPVDGGRVPLAEAIVLTAEDGLSDTVAPRLVAAGADRSKVHFLTGTKIEGVKDGDQQMFDLTADIEVLRKTLKANPAVRIIVIDPLTAYLGATQAQRNAQVRAALTPLVHLMEETGVAVIGITHLNKGQGKAIYRVLDSIAFVAVGRLIHMVIDDADKSGNFKFLCDKTNLGPKPPGLTFICQQVEVGTEDGPQWVSRISWGTEHIQETADQALQAEAAPAEAMTATDDAVEFLRAVLVSGPVAVKDVEREAVEACLLAEGKSVGYSKPFRDARKVLGVRSIKAGMAKGWVWALPKVPSKAEGALPNTEGIFGNAGHLRAPARSGDTRSTPDLAIPDFLRRQPAPSQSTVDGDTSRRYGPADGE